MNNSLYEYLQAIGKTMDYIKPLPEKYQPKGKIRYYATVDGQILSTYYKKVRALAQTPNKENNGYLRVCLCVNGKCYYKRVHRLIAETFIENPENKYFVHHKNSNERFNNAVSNLQWVSLKEHIEIHCQVKESEG